ncbi:MAG: recombinase family protein [Firmicutes bacterium]|nr:recombinase family protein [Bacillota bacterium]
MERTVTVIPQTINPMTRMSLTNPTKRKTAGYARVSTDSEEQLTSYEAQVDYYTKFIKKNPQWEFVKVYTDEGLTGVMRKHRDGFNEMIKDALEGKIDLIITKSVSRFARNTVDTLVTVRELKDNGVEVYFEKENIYTLDSKGELFITIMSSLAQEESRSISENVTWGHRKRFADGKFSLAYKNFLGYEKGEDKLPKIVKEEAELVRRIYSMFIDGKTPGAIARQLTTEGIPTPANKEKWRATTIQSILTNEKYKGSALLQKGFTVSFLTKKRKVNEGEVPQYYIEHSHEAIISPDEFDLVQQEMARREKIGNKYSGNSIFSCRLICGDCGSFLGSKVWQSNTKYRRTIWQCRDKFKNEKKCETPHLTEDEIKMRFLSAYSQLLENRDELIEDCRLMQDALTDTTEIDEEIERLDMEIEVVNGLIRQSITENATTAQNQDDYNKRYNEYAERYEKLKNRKDKLEEERRKRNLEATAIGGFMFEVMELPEPPSAFDNKLWIASIDYATIYKDGRMVFKFINGAEIEA